MTPNDWCDMCGAYRDVDDLDDGICAECRADIEREAWLDATEDRVVREAESRGWFHDGTQYAQTGTRYITLLYLSDDDDEAVDEVVVRVSDHLSSYASHDYSIVWPGARRAEHTMDQVVARLDAARVMEANKRLS